jgi:hypothetical protein
MDDKKGTTYHYCLNDVILRIHLVWFGELLNFVFVFISYRNTVIEIGKVILRLVVVYAKTTS